MEPLLCFPAPLPPALVAKALGRGRLPLRRGGRRRRGAARASPTTAGRERSSRAVEDPDGAFGLCRVAPQA